MSVERPVRSEDVTPEIVFRPTNGVERDDMSGRVFVSGLDYAAGIFDEKSPTSAYDANKQDPLDCERV